MEQSQNQHQAPAPLWIQTAEGTDPAQNIAAGSDQSSAEVIRLQQRVQELESRIVEYESLLEELPELFERKFQQRLEPLLERYRLLARAQHLLTAPTPPLLKAAMRWRRRPPATTAAAGENSAA